MACYHLWGDPTGETRLDLLELPEKETFAGRVRGLDHIPTTSLGLGAFVGRKPDVGIHTAPRRQFLVVLGGVMEIETTTGQKTRLYPGDVMLADDIGSKGHASRDVGDEPLMMMAIAIADAWESPPRSPCDGGIGPGLGDDEG